ncbi:GntR family transcriptional regulator [Leucobacter weissii]|uniref:GntR family transcriptional regulator n=2 Tax=Leucobacter weissii TaxID=1983706 RepID=A0A939MH95_9MICO|nr:GntR family transcriptional regulator [Leucobacter weissii]
MRDTERTDGAPHSDGLAFAVDRESAVPPSAQLRDAVLAGVGDGTLTPGQRLPTVRGLAARLGIAANTVAGAYRALERAGVIEGRGRAGTFVSLGDDPVAAEARRIALETAAALAELGVDRDEAIRLLTEAVAARPGRG